MASYSYQQNVFEGEKYGYIKYNITPDFGTKVTAGENITISGELFWAARAIKSLTVEAKNGKVTKNTVYNISVSKGAKKTFSFSFPVWDMTEACAGARFVDVPITFTLWDELGGSGNGDALSSTTTQSISYLRYRIGVSPSNIMFERCTPAYGGYESNDEGTSVRGSFKIRISSESTINDITTAEVNIANDNGFNKTQHLSHEVLTAALSGSGYSETEPSLFESITFDTRYNYTLNFMIGDEYDTYTFSPLVARAFANMHLSGCKKGGVAFGRFSASTDTTPMFECDYPASFYGGISVADGGVEELVLPFDDGAIFKLREDNPLQPTLRRFGHVIELHGEIQPTQSISGSTTYYPICTLPFAYAPHHDIVLLQQGTEQCIWMLRIYGRNSGENACKVKFSRYRKGSSWASASATTWLPFHATWII